MATEMDALSLNITGSSANATKAIDNLISRLKDLDNTFKVLSSSSTYSINLETAVHSITRVHNAIANINAQHISEVAKAMKSLGNAGNTLAGFGNVSQVGKAMDSVSASSRKMAESISKQFNIKDKTAIDNITASIQRMNDNIGKGDAYYDAESKLASLINENARYNTQLTETLEKYKILREYLNDNTLYIPKGASQEQDFLQNRARIGIRNTTSDPSLGISIEQMQRELKSMIPELQNIINPQDIFGSLANYLESIATPAMVGFDEAVKQGSVDGEAIRDAINQVNSSLGVLVPTLEQLESARNSIDPTIWSDFNEGTVAEEQAIRRLRDELNGFTQEVGSLRTALSSTSESEQPFTRIVNGLSQLEGVTIGDFSNISVLAEGVNKLGYQSAVTASQTLPQIAEGLRSFDGITLPELGNMTDFSKGLRSMGGVAVQRAATALPFIADGLKQLKNVGDLPKMEGLNEFAKALSIFGRKTSETAVSNIPKLTQAFQQLFNTMSKAPRISQNTIDAANAMANLASRTGGVTRALNGANPKLSLWSSNAGRAAKSSFSLASAIGKVYATYWMLFRAFGMIGKAINIASDMTEVRNVVVQAFGDMAYKANEFANIAGESFGMSKLQALDAASRYQAMGKTMEITDAQVLKANTFLQEKLSDTLALKKVQQGYGDLGDTAADMSINLSKLAGDLASLYNVDIDVAAEKLNSIFTGTTKPLREFGFDLTQATLQEWALKNGIDANVKSMTQAQKAVLRYQYVMANASFVMGDFARTSESWHNSIVRLKLAFTNLGSVIGQGFINLLKPAVQRITAFVNTLTKLVEKAINAIGKLLGWQVQIDPVKPLGDGTGGGSGLEDMEDAAKGAGKGAEDTADAMEDADKAADDTADNLDKAQKAAKKMKDYLLGIDELNVFRPDEETEDALKDKKNKDKKDKADKNKAGSGGGSGAPSGGAGEGGATGGDVIFKPYKSLIDSWFELGKTIADTIGDALWNIDWKSIQNKAEKAASNLAQFLNGIFASKKLWTGIGHTIAEGLNTALSFLETFVDRFNWGQFGRRIGDMINQAVADFKWEKLGRTLAKYINAAFEALWNFGITFKADKLGEGIASSINEFFSKLDAHWIARGLNIWVDKIKELLTSIITKTDWGNALKKISQIFSELDVDTLIVMFGAVAWKLAGKALTYRVIQDLLITNLLSGAKDLILAIPRLLVKFGSLIFSGLSAKSLIATVSQEMMGLSAALPQILKLYLIEPITTFISGTAIPAITSALGSVGGAIGLTGSAAVLGGFAVVAAAIAGAIAIVFNWDKIKKMKLGDALAKEIKFAFLELPNKLGNLGATIGSTVGNAIKTGLEFAFIKVPNWLAEQASKINIVDAFHGIGEKIGSVLGNLIKLAISGIVGMLSLDGGVIIAINNFVSNLVVSFLTAIANTDWSTIGINILKGIVFIFTIPGRVIAIIGEAIAGLFIGVYDGIAKAFGISSPAEKMKPLGGYILLGIVEGFKAKISAFVAVLNDWYNNSVKPWFTIDKWKSLGTNIVNGLITKWNEFKTQWITSITTWWNSNVLPWFNLEKWKAEADHIRESIVSKFKEMVQQWITDISNWWNQHVVKWLDLNKWKSEADHIREAIISKFTEMVSEWITKIETWWTKNVLPYFELSKWKEIAGNIKKGIIGAIDDTIKEWGGKIDQLVNDFRDKFKTSEFKKIGEEAMKSLWEGLKGIFSQIKQWWDNNVANAFSVKTKVESDNSGTGTVNQNSGSSSKKKTSKKASGGIFDDGRWRNVHAYAAGGVPDEGQLFWARESGAELVGTIGGNTAVMNNDQIVASVASGVQQAVTEALAPYLSDISTNTRITANKDFSVQIGDRQIAEANNRGQRQIGAAIFT